MNARNELQELITDSGKNLICARIYFYEGYSNVNDSNDIELPIGFLEWDLFEFWGKLNQEYYSGFGEQKLYGLVWLSEGCWLSRREYDGSEWWVLNERPVEMSSLSIK